MSVDNSPMDGGCEMKRWGGAELEFSECYPGSITWNNFYLG